MAKKQSIKRRQSNTTTGVPQHVRKYIERLQKEFVLCLKASKIPALAALATDDHILESYFTRREFHEDLLGSSIEFLDRCFCMAASSVVTKDLMTSMFYDTQATYPGLWNQTNIQSLALTMINVREIEDDPENSPILDARRLPLTHHTVTKVELESNKDNQHAWMPFNAFTPDRLVRFCMIVQATCIGAIVNEIRSNIPAAKLSTHTESLAMRYGRELGSMLENAVSSLPTAEEITADDFVDAFENPFMSYLIALLSESGFSGLAIKNMVAGSKANVVYSLESANGSKKASTFVHPWVKMTYGLYHEIGDGHIYQARFTVSPADIIEVATPVLETDADGQPIISTTRKNAQNRVGKALIHFMDEITKYIIQVYLHDPHAAEQNPTAEMTAPAVESVSEETVTTPVDADLEGT